MNVKIKICWRAKFRTYGLSQDGRVWVRSAKRFWQSRKLTPYSNTYLHTTLGNKNGRKKIYIHRLMLETFVGPCPPGCEAAHNNGIKTDNRLSNLRWATRKENQADRVLHGTVSRGEMNGRSKLVVREVLEIRRRLRAGCSVKSLSIEFSVRPRQIEHIQQRTVWKHI